MVVLVKAIFWISFGDGSPRILSMCFVKNCVKSYLLCFPNFLMKKFLLVGTLISVSKHLPFFLSSAIIPGLFAFIVLSVFTGISQRVMALCPWTTGSAWCSYQLLTVLVPYQFEIFQSKYCPTQLCLALYLFGVLTKYPETRWSLVSQCSLQW